MANPATVDDLEARWRPLSSQESINGTTFLDDAWRMLKRRVSNIEADMATDVDLEAEVVRVLATAVLRVMKNPDGKRREGIDDYSWERDQSVSSGLLYFTDDDLGDVSPDTATGAFTITPFGEPGYATNSSWDLL